jgi:hypothetical protein
MRDLSLSGGSLVKSDGTIEQKILQGTSLEGMKQKDEET